MKAKKKMGALCEEGTENLIDPAYIENLAPEEWQVDEIGLRTWKITALVDAPSYRYPVRSNYVWIPENQTATLSVYLLDRSASYMAIRVSGFSELGQIEDGRWRLTKAHSAEWAYRICYVNNFAEVKKGDYIIVKDPQIEMGSYPTSISDGTRAPSLLRLPLTTPLPNDFGVGLSARMLHESAVKDRTFWQAGPYALKYDSAEEKIKMQFGEVEATVDAEWSEGEIVGVYGGQRDGRLFLQSKVAGEMGEEVESEGWGENLVLNGDFSSGLEHWTYSGANTIEIVAEGYSGNGLKCTVVVSRLVVPRQAPNFSILPAGHYIMQAKIKTDNHSDLNNMKGRFASLVDLFMDKDKTEDLGNNWKLYYFTMSLGSDLLILSSHHIGFYEVASGTVFIVDDLKLELGSTPTPWTPTPWTPAPEDYEPIDTITIGSSADGESGHLNAVIADFAYHFTPEKIDPAGYLRRVPGGGD